MANKVPNPTLDTRSGDLVVAEAIGSLPAELSDRSDADPAVVILEAAGSIFDHDLFQLNQLPQAVITQALALIGINLLPANAGTVQQQFTLTAPTPIDSIIPINTQISTSDGTVVYATTASLTISAYAAQAGTITLTSGSTSVTGSGTAFNTALQVGWQISTDKNTWYTISAIGGATSLTLTASAAATVSASAYYAGGVTGTASAQGTVAGSASTVSAGALNTLVSSVAGVASTTNPAASSLGTNLETTSAAQLRAPLAFAGRATAASATDFGYFAQLILGSNGRATAQLNQNGTAIQTGYVSIGMLSPNWTISSSVSTQEQANVMRDANQRITTGTTIIPVPAQIIAYTTQGSGGSSGTMFACAAYRHAQYDQTSTQTSIAGAINSYLSPNSYAWGRNIDPGDLTEVIAQVRQVDHVATINGVVAVGMNYTVTANAVTVTNGSTSATGTASDFTNMTAGQTFLMDAVNLAVYLVTNISSGTLTITPAFAGQTNTATMGWFTSTLTKMGTSGNSFNDAWYSLPYSALSVVNASPPASVLIVGAI